MGQPSDLVRMRPLCDEEGDEDGVEGSGQNGRSQP